MLIELIKAEYSDLNAEIYVRWLTDPEVNKYLMAANFNLEEEKKWLRDILKNPNEELFNIFADGKLIGNMGAHDLQNAEKFFEIGIMIGEKEYWDKGCGTEAIKQMLKHLFEEKNAAKIYLRVRIENDRAIKCYEKCGFKIAASEKNSKGEDDYIMEILK
jgi:RimJ/RimL family protein N-acetyltransferase